MPWLKTSDAAAHHPIVLRALELDEADDRTANELFGFVMRCAVSAAAYETDYVISVGVIKQIAGFSRWKQLTDAAVACGYLFPMKDDQDRVVYRLVQEEDLFHMRLKDEVAWERQQRNDNRDTRLTVPVRKRDGDECRWCGKIVNWRSRKGGRRATYEHLHPGEAGTVDTVVVACGSCNYSRRDDALGWSAKLRPAPDRPYYGADTVEFLASHGVTVKPSDSLPIDVPGDRATTSLTPVEPSDLVEPNPSYEGRTVPSNEQSPGPDSDAVSSEPSTPTPEAPRDVAAVEPTPADAGRTAPAEHRVEPTGGTPSPADLAESGRSRQKPTLSDSEVPGRDGTGRDGKVRAGKKPGSGRTPHPSKNHQPDHGSNRRVRRGRRRR